MINFIYKKKEGVLVNEKKSIGIISSLCLFINSFLCTFIYLPFFKNGVRDYNLYYAWRAGAIVQCAVSAVLILLSIVAGAIALWSLFSVLRGTDSKIPLGSFFALSAFITVITFGYLSSKLHGYFLAMGIGRGFALLLGAIVVFLLVLLPDAIMCAVCFLSRKKPDSPLLALRFLSPVIPALTVSAIFITFFPGAMFYISDYGMSGFLKILVEDGWIIAVPSLALIFYTVALILISILIKREKREDL